MIRKILDVGTIVIPFVICAIGIIGWLIYNDSYLLHEACIWGVIGCVEGRLDRLEKKNGAVH